MEAEEINKLEKEIEKIKEQIEREIEKKERIVQTYLIIVSILIAYNQNQNTLTQKIIIFSFFAFLINILSYYIHLTQSDIPKTRKSISINSYASISAINFSFIITFYSLIEWTTGTYPDTFIVIICFVLFLCLYTYVAYLTALSLLVIPEKLKKENIQTRLIITTKSSELIIIMFTYFSLIMTALLYAISLIYK